MEIYEPVAVYDILPQYAYGGLQRFAATHPMAVYDVSAATHPMAVYDISTATRLMAVYDVLPKAECRTVKPSVNR